MKKSSRPGERESRPYIGVYFRCCGVYQRIYRRPDQDRYFGYCPRCMRPLTVRVSPDGTEERIFEAE